MQLENIVPDEGSFVNVLRACHYPEFLEKGKVIHTNIVQRGFDSVLTINTALISMYGKCGALEETHYVFDGVEEKNLVLWTAIITAYTQQGYGEEAIQLFKEMRLEGISPDIITLVSILGAYANLDGAAEHVKVIQAC